MGIRLTARQVLFGYVAVMALLAAAHYAHPGSRTWTADAMNALAVVAMAAGAAVNRPARRAPRLLLAAAHLTAVYGADAGVVSVLKYPLIIAALLIFIRSRRAGRDLRDS